MPSVIDRKFYSENDELLCTLKYLEFSTGQINLNVNLEITKQLDAFQKIFLNQTLEPLKQKNDNIEVQYEFYEDTDTIEKIEVLNLTSIDDYNFLTSNILKLLNTITETVITSKIERRFYSNDDNLVCIVNYLDFNRVVISFTNPDKLHVTKESERYMEKFIEDTAGKFKEEYSSIRVTYDYYDESKIIESIEFLNVDSIQIYNYITEKVMELLSSHT